MQAHCAQLLQSTRSLTTQSFFPRLNDDSDTMDRRMIMKMVLLLTLNDAGNDDRAGDNDDVTPTLLLSWLSSCIHNFT